MKGYIFSANAEEDLAEIAEYIARDNPEAADELVSKIAAKCSKLVEFPSIGDLLYKIKKDHVYIIRIFHAARELRPDFFE